MEKEDFKWKLGRIVYDLAEGKIGVLDAYERYDAIENEKAVLPQAVVIKSVCEHETVVMKKRKGWVCTRCNEPVKDKQTVL